MMRASLSWLASRIKGTAYRVDESIPIGALVSFSFDRALSLLRCFLRGLVFSWDPRDLVMLGKGVKLRNRRFLRFGRGVTIGDHVFIDGLSRSGISFGHGATIGSYGQIKATGVLTNIGEGVTIGDYSSFDSFVFIGAAGGVEIGRYVIGGQRVSFHAESHNFESIACPIREQGTSRKGIRIGDDCWIGAGVIFLDGADVSHGCVIGAGAVVRGQFPPYSVIVGVPARVVAKRDSEELSAPTAATAAH